MKLAEALMRRADLNREYQEIVNRISSNATHEEDDAPEENMNALWYELNTNVTQQQALILNIQRTNLGTDVEFEGQTYSLMDLILLRDAILKEYTGKSHSLIRGGRSRGYFQRASRDDIKFVPTLDQSVVRENLNTLAALRRRVDAAIQQTNWNTDLTG